MNFTAQFLKETAEIALHLYCDGIEKMVEILAETKRNKGRLFILGVGGSAANASHAVNDFRKICGIEAYTPTDNVAELTARTNDDGWETVFSKWLQTSNLSSKDTVLVLSVGGGTPLLSANLMYALEFAEFCQSKIIGILGRDGGYTAKSADAFVLIPTVNPKHITPHTESFQIVLLHLIVNHPKLQ